MFSNERQCGRPREADAAGQQVPDPCAPGNGPGACCEDKAGAAQSQPWAAMLAWCGCGTTQPKAAPSPPEMV